MDAEMNAKYTPRNSRADGSTRALSATPFSHPGKCSVLNPPTMEIENLLLLAICLLLTATSETDGELIHEEHKTQAASRKPNNLSCYVCEMDEDPRCLNMSEKETKWKRKCSEDQTMCMVKRFAYSSSSAENATSVVIALERNCSKHCEPGCIVIRTRLSVCTACCDRPFCNWVSRSIVSYEPSSYLLSGIILAAVVVSLPS